MKQLFKGKLGKAVITALFAGAFAATACTQPLDYGQEVLTPLYKQVNDNQVSYTNPTTLTGPNGEHLEVAAVRYKLVPYVDPYKRENKDVTLEDRFKVNVKDNIRGWVDLPLLTEKKTFKEPDEHAGANGYSVLLDRYLPRAVLNIIPVGHPDFCRDPNIQWIALRLDRYRR